MTEPTPPSLAERTLQRLRRLAAGNGLEPMAIESVEKQEDIFTFGGLMEVTPWCETQSATYPGPVKGRDRRLVSSLAAMAQQAAAHQQQFREKPDWLLPVTEEVKKQEGSGWGLDSAKVSLPERSAVFAASDVCPACQGSRILTCEQCQGRGIVTCTQCQGQGQEQCYHCLGRGEDPQQPGQRCPICHGRRFAPCRFCHTQGHLPCPTCMGRRGTSCVACQGTGQISQEISVNCGAETHFKLVATDLPSGFRRGLERVGVANLAKGGHGDVVAAPPAEDKDAPPRDKPPFPIITYTARVPYAEMRMVFGNKKRVVVSAFGKRCYIMGVPPFLDTSLKPWRDKLHLAAFGKASLEEVLDARALKELLSLIVAGKGRLEDARRQYPYGLSSEALKVIVTDLRLALNRVTLKTRSLIAGLSVFVAALVFHSLFSGGWLVSGAVGRSIVASLAASALLLMLALVASWAGLNFATRFVLKKRFPQLTFALNQKIGKTGLGMLGGIVVAFVLFMLLSPVRPLWLALLLR